MATRWPKVVDDAIAEAAASGLRFTDAHRKLKAGTLPGLAEPVPMSERTFSGKWSRAKRRQQRARDNAPVCPECGRPRPGAPTEAPKERDGPSLLERIKQDIAAERENAAAAESTDTVESS